MKIILIDGERIKNSAEMYAAVREVLPEGYLIGDNLDALYDALTSVAEPTGIILVNTEALRSAPGVRWHGLVRALEDATDENGYLSVLIDPFGTDPSITEL